MPKRKQKRLPEQDFVPGTEEIHIQEIVNKTKGAFPEWLLVTQEKIFPPESAAHSSRDSLIGDMGSALTCHHHIIAIFHRGERISATDVEALEKEAYEGLGPISQARARGEF